MKQVMSTALLCAVLVPAVPVRAQEGNVEGKDRAARMERMSEELGLTPEQNDRMKAIEQVYAEKAQAIRAMEDKDAQLKARKALHAEKRAAVQAVLNPEQRAKAEALRKERMQERQGRLGDEASVEERAERRTEWLTKELELSDDQAAKVKAIHVQHLGKMEHIRSMPDEAQRRKAMQEVRGSQQKALEAVLTTAQQQRLKELKAQRKAEHQQRQGREPGQRKG
jgi:periplasmic protein CpxP/Spy